MKKIFLLPLFIGSIAFSQIHDSLDKVGIGTTTPSEKLEVVGNIKAISSNPNISIVGTGTGNYHGATLKLTVNGVSPGKEHVSTLLMTHRGTGGTATIELQRRNHLNAYRGGLLFYRDDHGWDFRTALTTTSTGTGTRLTIKNSGNVGIGTNTPSEKLDVNGTGKFGNGSATPLTLMSSSGSRSINLHSSDDVKRGELGWNTGSYFLRNTSDNKLFEVNFSTGKIATNGASLNYELNIHDPGTGAVDSRIQLTNADTGKTTADGFQMIMNGATNNYKVNLLNRENSDMGFWTNNTERITISNIGNVGIGTTDTKGFRLGVNGKIAAEEVKVATYANWADFVFENNYNLPTLKEVENHIKEKGHLKDIPSAEEVKKEGFYLGEMDSKLLQKIEELTLYTIEQEKKIEELSLLKKENELLRKKFDTLEALVSKMIKKE